MKKIVCIPVFNEAHRLNQLIDNLNKSSLKNDEILFIHDGSKDKSPNSGISEAIFAHSAKVKMGGINSYKNTLISKPILAKDAPVASPKSINRIMNLSLRLELAWIASIGIISFSTSMLRN